MIIKAQNKDDSNILIYIFQLWTFVLIARPQDFVKWLEPIRPAMSIGIVVVIVYGFYHSIYKHKLLDNQQCRLYLILLAIMMVSIPFAYYRRSAFEFFFTQYIVAILYFIVFYRIIDKENKLTNIIWIACMSTSTYLLATLYQGEMETGRLKYGQMYDPNDIAFLAVSSLPFNILFISKDKPCWKRLSCFINIIIGITVILLTGSRGGFIALGVVLIMLLFTRKQVITKFFKFVILSLTIAAIVYGGATIDFSRYGTIAQIEGDYNIIDETGRVEIWKKGLGLMLSNPLLGVGVSCFSEAIGQERKNQGLQEIWQAPHNSIVQIGTEAGIFGLILFVLISIRAFIIFANARNIGHSEKYTKIGEIAKIGFAGHITASMFLSQAYSIYWVFFVVISAVMTQIRSGALPHVGSSSKSC